MKHFNFSLGDIEADNLFACIEHEIENTQKLVQQRDYSNYPDEPYYDKHWNSFLECVSNRVQYLNKLIQSLTHTTRVEKYNNRKNIDDLLNELRHTENCVTQSVLVDCIIDRLKRKEYE